MDKSISHNIDEKKLYDDVSHLIEISRTGVMLYWHIGHRINHDILKFSRAEYGAQVIKNLAAKLQTKFGSGFGHRVIHRCSQFEKSGIRVSQFITEIPPKEIFEKRLHDAIQRAREIESIKLLNNNDIEE